MTTQIVVAFNSKAYFSRETTAAWAVGVREILEKRSEGFDFPIVVIPQLLALGVVQRELAGLGVVTGAQDCSAFPPGPATGEVPTEYLVEAGCQYVVVGHTERASLLDESAALVSRKIHRALDVGLTPIVCVGEPEHRGVRSALRAVSTQLETFFAGVQEDVPVADIVLAYEPVWAIGADSPAPQDFLLEVGAAISGIAGGLVPGCSVTLIYGGTAGPGTLSDLAGVYDGIFLGRRAHDPVHFCEVIFEANRLFSS